MTQGTLPISVIMPMRDAAAHASAAIRQTRSLDPQPAEIIIVLDGCRDSTKSLVMAASAGMRNLQLIELDEGVGPGGARNAGLTLATERFIWFCDCDDTWEPGILSALYTAAQRAGADVSICAAWSQRDGSASKRNAPSLSMKRIAGEVAICGEALRWLLNGDVSGHVWNKLIRRSLLGPAPFSDLQMHEDLYAMLDVLAGADRVVATRQRLYTYVQGREYRQAVDNRNIRALVSVRDHARQIVATNFNQSRYWRALACFEARAIAIAILQIASRAEYMNNELHDITEWARSAIRTPGFTELIRRRDFLAVSFAALAIVRFERLPYLGYRLVRKSRASGG